MDEIVGSIVNVIELIVELQNVFHPVLEQSDCAGWGLARMRNPGPRLDHFVQQRIEILKIFVERVIVRSLGNVNRAEEMDDHAGVVFVFDFRGFQRATPLSIVHKSEELARPAGRGGGRRGGRNVCADRAVNACHEKGHARDTKLSLHNISLS